MRLSRITRTLAALALSVPSPVAQATLIVDASNGPGTQFTDLPPAVLAAAPGDRIVVRPGTYTPFTTDKPLSIVGSSLGTAQINGLGPTIVPLVLQNLPAGTDFVLRGVLLATLVRITDCRGRVLLDDVDSVFPTDIDRCDQVMLNRCDRNPGATITDSTVTMTECSVSFFLPPAPLRIVRSTVHLADTDVIAAIVGFELGAPAIQMTDATVTVAGDANTTIAAGGSLPFSAIAGTGVLTLDPDVVLDPAAALPAVEPTVTVALAELPTLSVQGAPVGGTLGVDVRGEPADLFVLLVGSPGAAVPIPALQGALWIAPATIIPVASGNLDPAGHFGLSFLLPADPAFVGVPVAWVAVAGQTVQSLRLTNNAGHTQSAD